MALCWIYGRLRSSSRHNRSIRAVALWGQQVPGNLDISRYTRIRQWVPVGRDSGIRVRPPNKRIMLDESQLRDDDNGGGGGDAS